MNNRERAHAANLEAKMYWHVEHGTGLYPDLEKLIDDKEALAIAIGKLCYPGWTFEQILEEDKRENQ